MVRKFGRSHVDRLGLELLLAVSGVAAGVSACAGRSERSEGPPADSGNGGTGAAGKGGIPVKGGSGGSSNGGTGGITSKGGTGGSSDGGTGVLGGSGGASGSGVGGGPRAGSGGSSNGGAGHVTPHGCVDDEVGHNAYAYCAGSFVHRPNDQVCTVSPHPTPPEVAGAGGEPAVDTDAGTGPPIFASCATDADCTDGPEGYCIRNDSGQVIDVSCKYACKADSDCSTDEVCSCEDGYTSAVSGQSLALGICRPATCEHDSDCGDGFLCIAPLQAACGQPTPSDYHCQTPSDQCGGPQDCAVFSGYECNYRDDHYVCEGAPVCGRPFLVEGVLRQSELATEATWIEGDMASAPLGELTDAEREAIARHWGEAGLMEHASVAAFARFTLQLMALGAPAELVEAATLAMADETRHAKACFGLATRYAGRTLGPGPLDVTNALGPIDLLGVVELVVDEGCIGETGAALEAAWAAEAATDPVVRRVLLGIAEDEARHAALAWRFVAWAAKRDDRVARVLERRLRDALARDVRSLAADVAEVEASLAAHGVLGERERREARRVALSELLPPLVALLLPPASETVPAASTPSAFSA